MPLEGVHLTTVLGSFEAKVLVATELRGAGDGPDRLPTEVHVFVGEMGLRLAREILLADALGAAFSEVPRPPNPRTRAGFRPRRREAR